MSVQNHYTNSIILSEADSDGCHFELILLEVLLPHFENYLT
jgi:DNA gyrase/topoisomerase IV subunit B